MQPSQGPKITFLFFGLSRGRRIRDCGSDIKLGGACHVSWPSRMTARQLTAEIGRVKMYSLFAQALTAGLQIHVYSTYARRQPGTLYTVHTDTACRLFLKHLPISAINLAWCP